MKTIDEIVCELNNAKTKQQIDEIVYQAIDFNNKDYKFIMKYSKEIKRERKVN